MDTAFALNYHLRKMVLMVAILATALAAAAEPASEDRTAQVLATQTARFQAMLDADVAALNDVLADDLVYAHTTGTIDSKSSMIDNIGSGAVNYELIEPTDTKIRLYGDVAVVTGSSNMRVSVGDQVHQIFIRFIEVYAAKDDHWQLVSWQSTRVP
jgi:ketosteroid isomerase-like protein